MVAFEPIGMGRATSELPHNFDLDEIHVNCIHLTNDAIQKDCEDYGNHK